MHLKQPGFSMLLCSSTDTAVQLWDQSVDVHVMTDTHGAAEIFGALTLGE